MSKTKNIGYEISDGYNILMLKTEEGNYENVLNILNEKQIDVNAANKKGYTALSLAVKAGFYEIVELLISRGANINVRNNSGQSPLFLSCWCNHINLVSLLLSKGAEINTTDQRGWSALTIAAYHGNIEIVQILIENNADVSNQDSFGKRAIHRAKDPRIIKMLQMVENKMGLQTSSYTQRTNTSIVLKTETSVLSQGTLLLKNILPPTSNTEIPDVKRETPTNLRRALSPSLNTLTSPSSRTSKPQKVNAQSDKKIRKPNISCDQNAFMPKSPVRQITTPVGTKSSLEKLLSPKMAEIRKARSPNNNYGGSTNAANNFTQATNDKKEVVDDYVFTQMKQVSDQLQDIIEQRIAVEVARQVQEYQDKIRKGLESLLYTKMAYSFKELQASFNSNLKTLLNKLGYGASIEQLLSQEEEFVPREIALKLDSLKLYNEREINAKENNIKKLEKVVGVPKINIYHPSGAKSLKDTGAKSSNSRGSLSNTRGDNTKNKAFDQMAKEIKAATENLNVYSKEKVTETVQNEAKSLEKNVWDELSNNMNSVEMEMKKKFETMMANKFAYLAEIGNNDPYSEDVTDDGSSFQDRRSSSDTKTLSQNTLKALKESEIAKESIQNSVNTSLISDLVKPLSFPKIERVVRIADTPPKYSFSKSEKALKSLDSIEEINSQKEQQTLPDLKDMTPVTLRGEGIVIEGFGASGKSPKHKSREQSEKNLVKKKEEETSSNRIPSLSESSGPVSNEYRMEGLKRFYGKAAMDDSKQSKPRNSSNSSNQVQIPGHYFSFGGSKAAIQFDFSADD